MNEAKIHRLENYYRKGNGAVLWVLLCALVAFIVWANTFKIDEVVRAQGELVASSRVQIIQAVDGGVISELNVREGDLVKVGDVLAKLDQTRIQASVAEVKAKLFAVKAKAVRLRAEVTQADILVFPDGFENEFVETEKVERALFEQRKRGFAEEARTLNVTVDLAKQEVAFTNKLYQQGDASVLESMRAQRSLNEAEAKLINHRNQFLEEARLDLARAEDDIAQNEQIYNRKLQEQKDSLFVALVPGVVKNVRVTTVGGVLRAGEEIMQIVPVNDELFLEAKVMPSDIAQTYESQTATLRFDAYDYTIYGAVEGRVVYVSADTLKEDTGSGTDIFYRVHLIPSQFPVVTQTGRSLTIMPGMTAQVDIKAGERTLIDYLLKPLRKTLTESFGER